MRIITVRSKEWEKLIQRGFIRRAGIEDRVRRIVDAVRTEGDEGLLR